MTLLRVKTIEAGTATVLSDMVNCTVPRACRWADEPDGGAHCAGCGSGFLWPTVHMAGRVASAEARGRGEVIAALTHGDEFNRIVGWLYSDFDMPVITREEIQKLVRAIGDYLAEQSRLSAPVVALQAEKDSA